MRILFISTTSVGGSGRSQRELARRLAERGHEVSFLVDLEQPERVRRWAYGHLSDLSARLDRRPGKSIIRWLEALPGRRAGRIEIDELEHLTSPIPENAALRVLQARRPDVVIGNSVLRLTWRKVRTLCELQGITTVLYIREIDTLNHFEPGVRPADAVVANAESLARQVESLGFACSVFPSIIETGVTRVESTRQAALVINPTENRGINMVWQLAERLPEVRFVVQEAWTLGADDLASVERRVAALPNVEFRLAEPPGPRLYRDARVLLVPHRIDNRPRVIAEAQANGIPAIVADSPALVEAVGGGGVVVGVDDIDGWCAAITAMWSDAQQYERLTNEAFAHSARDEISAASVAARFDEFVTTLRSTR